MILVILLSKHAPIFLSHVRDANSLYPMPKALWGSGHNLLPHVSAEVTLTDVECLFLVLASTGAGSSP